MLRWETVDPDAIEPLESYSAVSGKHEFRIFHDPEERYGGGLAWILGVREVPEGGVPTQVYYHAYHTEDEAKRGAKQWEGPPPTRG